MSTEHASSWLFDESRTEHRKALRKLEHDVIAWFITVDAQGDPHSVPVWFFWHEGTLIVMSEPDSAKVRHVRRGSPVLVHLEGGRFGNDVVVLNGTAEISERSSAEWLTDIGDIFNVKYAEGIEDYDYGADADAIVQKFSAVIIVTPTKLMAW